MKNYYDELEVSKTASKEVIEKVYKVLAKKYHPDTTKEADKQAAEEHFKIISEAYEVLSDDEKRKKYDLELEQTNPKISYEDYLNIVNQRDSLNNTIRGLQNELNQFKNSYNSNTQYNNWNTQAQYDQNQFNQTHYNENINNYQRPPVNPNTTNNNTNSKSTGKKYYYNTVTGEPVSSFEYYKYRIRKFFSNLGFYILVLIALYALFRNIFSMGLKDLFY